jgi:hypothetical protein
MTAGFDAAGPLAGCCDFTGGLASPSGGRGLGGVGTGADSGFDGTASFPVVSAGGGETGVFAGGFDSLSGTRGLAGAGAGTGGIAGAEAGGDSGLGATGSVASAGTAGREAVNTNPVRAKATIRPVHIIMPGGHSLSIDDDIIRGYDLTYSGYRKPHGQI